MINKKMHFMNNLKTVLITGSSDGIGLEIAKTLSLAGYKVFLTGRSEAKLVEASNTIKAAGYLAGDLLDNIFVQHLVDTAINTLGHIDILINNAGGYVWSPIEKTHNKDLHDILTLNLEVPYKLSRTIVPFMKARKNGRIINIGSISGAVGEANASLYSASKAGLIGMTKSLALELAEYFVTVNVVNPGWVKTPLTEAHLNSDNTDEAEELDMIPQKRWIEPSEVAQLVKYLISDSAVGITGQSINLCCGLSLG